MVARDEDQERKEWSRKLNRGEDSLGTRDSLRSTERSGLVVVIRVLLLSYHKRTLQILETLFTHFIHR